MIKRYLESAYMLLGEDGERVQGSQLVDGQWYAPRWGCDSLQHFIDDIKDSLIEWHDLRENPEDLPPVEKSLVDCFAISKIFGACIASGMTIRRDLHLYIKWAYIPTGEV